MNRQIKHLATILLLATSSYLVASPHHDNVKALVESGKILSLEVILEKARALQDGKVLEVELESKRGVNIYEIELLTPKGVVLELKFNAQTGEHISTEEDD